MREIGKEYYYQLSGLIRHSVLLKKTSGWNIFENGDCIGKHVSLYESMEDLVNVRTLINTVCNYKYT